MHACRVLAFCLLVPAANTLIGQQPDFQGDPKFQKEITGAKDQRQVVDDRIGHWKKALKISNGTCVECLAHLCTLEIQSAKYKDAVATATALEQLVKTPSNKAYADLLRGSALTHFNHDKPKPEQLVEADAAFKAALARDPNLHMAAYMDGRALAALNRDAEAATAFAGYVQSTPAGDRFHVRAQHFAQNPALARARMAPPFTVTTSDGKNFTLDEMGGRVVLVDFWATWCGPCNEELPHMKSIAKEFAGQPFVLISVSWDKDEEKWHNFIQKHEMTWNQYRDADHELATAYGVASIPHYFTIDADGVLQDEKIGSGSNFEGKLRKLVSRAREAQVASQQTGVLGSSDSGTK